MTKRKLQEIVWDNDSFKIKGTNKTVFPFAVGQAQFIKRDKLNEKDYYSFIKELANKDDQLSYYTINLIPRTQKAVINFYRSGDDFMEQAAANASRRSNQYNY